MSTANNDQTLLIGGLLVAAFLFSRKSQLKRASQQPGKPLGTGSMPGSVGTGWNQVLGGLFGNAIASYRQGNSMFGSGPNDKAIQDNINFFKQFPIQDTVSSAPDWGAAMEANQDLADNVAQYGI